MTVLWLNESDNQCPSIPINLFFCAFDVRSLSDFAIILSLCRDCISVSVFCIASDAIVQ